MHTITRRLTVALAAAGLLLAAGCAKDETATTTDTTAPVSASSGSEGTTSTTADDEDDDKGTGGSTTTTDRDEDDTTTTSVKKSGAPSGDYEEACAKIEELEASSEDLPDEELFALMEEARDASPEELEDHWNKLIDIFDSLRGLDESSPEALEEALAVFEDQDYLAAAAAIDDFAEEECGLDISLDPAEEDGITLSTEP